ncbi:MAG: DNA polymerase III subunit delta [Alphaproteobacteria bacterium]|nr:MAG: DNA polymerase III subunit delta [Alphaproteobacteria bacterium]
MKITPANAESFLAKPSVPVVVLYGVDRGQVIERATRLARLVVEDIDDPFCVSRFPAEGLADSPARLIEEVSSTPMMGGRRLVWVRDADDKAEVPLRLLLDKPPGGDWMLIIEAGNLEAKSRLRKLAETAPMAAAVACYVSEGADLQRLVAGWLREAGRTASRDALDLLIQRLPPDRLAQRQELDKVLTYIGPAPRLEAEDVEACLQDQGTARLDEACLLAASGQVAALDAALQRLLTSEDNLPTSLLRAAQRHLIRLRQAQFAVQSGEPVDMAMKALRPEVFFRHKTAFAAQLRLWPTRLLDEALARMVQAEAATRSTGAPADLIACRALMDIARRAAALNTRAI